MKDFFLYLAKTKVGNIISLCVLTVLTAIVYNITESEIMYQIFLGECTVMAIVVLAMTCLGLYNAAKAGLNSLKNKEQ